MSKKIEQKDQPKIEMIENNDNRESKVSNDSADQFMRTVSLARPSVRVDILTEDDSESGILEKQSPNFFKMWQKRFFVLDQKILKYFKSRNDFTNQKAPKGVINFNQIWVEISEKEGLKFDIKI